LHPDGSLKWKFAAGGIVDSSPAIAADGTIYFGAHNGIFYALDAGGKARWTFATGSEITSSPALGADGSVYFSSTDGNLYRLKAGGTEAWRCRTGGGSDGSPVLADNGNIVVADGQLTLIISSAGAVLWNWPPPDWADGTPAVGQGVVCLMAPWHRVWAIKPDGKAESWTVSTLDNVTSSPIIGNHGEIYACSGNFLLAAQPPVPLLPANSSWPMFHANARHNGRVGE
jgi:outer membrane protein assembly factor BamB